MAGKGHWRESGGGVERGQLGHRGFWGLAGDSRALVPRGQFCFPAAVEKEDGPTAIQSILCPSPRRIRPR